MDLTIAIPTFNNFKQLVDTLLTLTTSVEYPYKIVVINNGDSVDPDGKDFEESLRKWVRYGHLKVITAGENLGWMKAINKAFVEECDTRLFCMMNDDLLFLPYDTIFLRQLCSYFRHPEIGAVGPCSNFAFSAQNLWRHGLPRVFITSVLIGFCMIVRSDLFSEIGGLDEGLSGGDDFDLSTLIRQRGFKLLVDRNCYVHHIGCQTGHRVSKDWNSPDYIEEIDNQLIRKHGVRAWFDTKQSSVDLFEPIHVMGDVEGDLIREWVGDLQTGIDIGCGHNKTIPRAVGVDKAGKGEMGVAGGRKFDASTADIKADASDLPMEDGSQDYIVARHLFEHLMDPIPVLKEWKRVLRPGGKLILACPNSENMNTIILDWTHLHAYTPGSLQSLLETCGFTMTRMHVLHPGISFVMEATPGNKAALDVALAIAADQWVAK